tara:strand:- start:642 stop:818 length:177 start_codon:yes stop_codon:yes gene_type:complete
MEEKLMDIHALAEMMCLPTQSMRKIAREEEGFPTPVLMGKRIRRWKQSEMLEWINKKT